MRSHRQTDAAIERAVAAIASADALFIGAGAGMGVDSGLPDFRGSAGFWKAYPPFKGKQFAEISNPVWFKSDPIQAWGFFGHRLNLYRDTVPHDGFQILRQWSERCPQKYFVFTSNVDGHFQRAGFASDRVVECHGSIRYQQCSRNCSSDIWSADDLQVTVDEDTIRATSDLPSCRHCDAIARPNILMFDDWHWLPDRCEKQEQRYIDWLATTHNQYLVSIELGAGTAIPTVRHECEQRRGKLIRINPRDHNAPGGAISIPLGALEALERINALL